MMKKTLQELWCSYLIESASMSEKEKSVLESLVLTDEILRAQLNDEQLSLLEKYDDCFHQLNYISETNAFVEGVCFATKFIFEALSDK